MDDWDYISECVDDEIEKIFEFHPIHTLSDYERSKIVFEHLTSKLTYDFGLLNQLIDAKITGVPIRRNPTEELLTVVNASIGICNGISQYYKLLLERIGIKSHCVICDDGTDINHQILLVHNSDTDTYSFDDVTAVIVGRGTNEEYFDYDVDGARRHNQGNKKVYEDRHFFILTEEYINYVVKRPQGPTPTLEYLPENIKSIKQKTSVK